jgi:selenocysteine lyase/cysteine desulfurase
VRGSAVRVSPHVFNTQDDVAALAEALRSVR